jgi:CheY-like chemotaxis protein
MQTKQKFILLADDDIEDLELLQEAIVKLEPETKVHSVTNGRMVLSYLEDRTDGELPSLIVLDYNMPDMNGAEVLVQLSNDPELQRIPKVIWSTSNASQYIEECMENGAKTYFVKPSTNKQLLEQAQEMLDMC